MLDVKTGSAISKVAALVEDDEIRAPGPAPTIPFLAKIFERAM
jgi:hypothetical protein